ncbi:hypothetical protein ACYAE2_002303 [Pseudomonas aeruginosa]
MTQQQISSPLSYFDAIRAVGIPILITGDGAEADADRLFVSRRWAEARETYSTLEVDSPARREKLAYCILSSGDSLTMDLMGQGIEEASPNGLHLHLLGVSQAVLAGNRTPETNKALVAIYLRAKECSLARQELVMTIVGCAYLSQRMSPRGLGVGENDLFESVCADLEALDSLHASPLRLYPLLQDYYRLRNDAVAAAAIKAEMKERLSGIQLDASPLLALPFIVAYELGDPDVMRSVVDNLCRRYATDPHLEETVSNAAIYTTSPMLLDCLPAELKQRSLNRPEVKLLMALHDKDPSAVLLAADFLATDKSYDSLCRSYCVADPLFRYLGLDHETGHFINGCWGSMYFWEASFADQLIEWLPAGAGRKKLLLTFLPFVCIDLPADVVKELAELFEENPSYDRYLELPSAAFEVLDPQVFARFLVDAGRMSPDEEFYFGDDDWSWDRFIPALTVILQTIEPAEREALERRLEGWGVPVHPTLSQNLAGMSLPDDVRNALAVLEGSLASLEPAQLPYLQLALTRIAGAVPDLVSPAVSHDVSIAAYNKLIKPRYLTKVGEDRMQKLAKRYGAAGVLRGIEALMTSSGFDSQAENVFDALSMKLVELQGTLQPRRAYLAGILRKRLPKLNTHWLDQQVVEAMRRGVDIEQMIELAKVVTSWDMWSDGVEDLRPY